MELTEYLLSVIADTQRALGFSDEQVSTANGSIEIVQEIYRLKEEASRRKRYAADLNFRKRQLEEARAELAELRKPADDDLVSDLSGFLTVMASYPHITGDQSDKMRSAASQMLAMQRELAELRKPVAVQRDEHVEIIRAEMQRISVPPESLVWSDAEMSKVISAYDTLSQDCTSYAKAHDALMAEIRGLRERLKAEENIVEKLQVALSFWLPGVPTDDPEIANRAGDDAQLLYGCDAPVVPCAEQLGWLILRKQVQDRERQLRDALQRIDAINDNPARFDSQINEVVSAALAQPQAEKESGNG